MKKISQLLGSVRMTTSILLLVMVSIIGSVGAISHTLYLTMHQRSIDESEIQQDTNLAVAATILERRISGSILTMAEDGSIVSFQSWAVPPFYDNDVIDSVSRVTKQDAAIYVLEKETGDLVAKTTTLLAADGSRAIDAKIASGDPTLALLGQGETIRSQMTLQGVPYLVAIQPIVGTKGDMMGAILVGTPMANVNAAAGEVLGVIGMVGIPVTIVFALLGFVSSRLISRPIPRLAKTMDVIAEGNYDIEVPYTGFKNEVGAMARAVEVFRENGLRVSQMTEAEAARIVADEDARRAMMANLQDAFGQVVDAAIAGDFSRRVKTEFPDAELNALAGGVNKLVGAFDHGVSEIGTVLSAMAEADFTLRMEGEFEGAFAKLREDTDAVADKLGEVVSQLRHTSGSIKNATGELLSGANDLSERTTRQAATIEETSAAMEQFASTVLSNAERASIASQNASKVTKTAEEGGRVMESANEAMDRITQSSSKISNIIGLIDDIAFQTNLLALNASVEAARAGEAGKGFAVVAVEVRRLAQSAAQASSEVKVLIDQSSSEVATGSKLVNDAASKLASVLDAIRENTKALETIAQQSSEQANSIEEVSSAVRQLDEMTQHNAALVEETNAAIAQAESQANELDLIVEVFAVDAVVAPAHHRSEANVMRPAATERPSRQYSSRGPSSQGNLAVSQDWNDF
ncbi:methyl-accepting chemotaxis protein [Devosia sp. WQ 349K1]|uniref:methyl-accepting chemotaxis protein n=1 Tax=Devosia sp. WQ 349K1 TaxID=2800329 RepID=UPI0020B2E748|nr:methyl-accepting chemotaxis protein [Devosia sp. WQ 349K1]